MTKKEKKDLLVFGYGLPLILTVLVTLHVRKHGVSIYPVLFMAFAVLVLVLTILDLKKVKLIYDKWMVVAHFIGNIVTTIILSFLFYAMFGIIGIILRVIKKDYLDRSLDSQQGSYWKKREVKEFQQKNYQRQF